MMDTMEKVDELERTLAVALDLTPREQLLLESVRFLSNEIDKITDDYLREFGEMDDD